MTTRRYVRAVPVSIVLSLLLFSTAVAQKQASAPPRIRIGQPFPEMSFPGLTDAALTNMTAFRGKKTILYVFASW